MITTDTWGLADRGARRRLDCSSAPARSTGWTSRAAACGSPATRPPTPAAPTRSRSRSASTATSTRPTAARRSGCSRARSRSDPPDLILLETLSLVRSSTYATIEALLDTGLPVWLSFRRCRHGVCGVYGEHWGGPEGDAFGRAARRFEEIGVGALPINCIPPDHVTGMLVVAARLHRPAARRLPEPRLPVGRRLAPRAPASRGRRLRRAGARLARGGRADHRRLLRRRTRAPRGRARRARRHQARPRAPRSALEPGRGGSPARGHAGDAAGATRRGRGSVPARRSRRSPSSPASSCRRRRASWSGSTSSARGSAPTSAASTSAAARVCWRCSWRATAPRTCTRSTSTPPRSRTRSRTRFATASPIASRAAAAGPLPVGAGGALRRDRRDPLPDAGRPVRAGVSHRPLDYWGRNLIDHLIRLLPEALADDGTAYIMQLSIIGERRTIENLDRSGYSSRLSTSRSSSSASCSGARASRSSASRSSPTRTTSRSARPEVMVAYLLEITRRGRRSSQ